MRLSIAVIAMSNLPSMRLVSWNTELGVGVSLTSIPFLANSPFSCATQIGQLKPPGKTMTLTGLGGAGGAPAHATSASTIVARTKRAIRVMSPPCRSAADLPGRYCGILVRCERDRSCNGFQRRTFPAGLALALAKLRDVRQRAPHAERLGRERELPRPIAGFFLGHDVLHADRVFVDHLVGSLEVKEAGRRGRVPPGPEDDFHALVAQEVIRAHHVVEGTHVVVDVLNAWMGRGEQSEGVMDCVHAQQGRIADPVRHPGVQEPRPERLVSRSVGGAQPDVAEMRDSGVARRKVAQPGMEGTHHDLDLVPGRVLEGEELLHPAQLAL